MSNNSFETGRAIGTNVFVDPTLIDLDHALTSLGLHDEMIEPMPCCGLPVRLGDTEFGVDLHCSHGRCVQYVCECGHCWASVETLGCPCRRSDA